MRKLGWITLVLVGCGTKDDPNPDGDEALVGCLADSTEAVTDLSATPEGFTESVQAMIDRVTGTFVGEITHPDDSTAGLAIAIELDGDPEVERRSWQDDGDDGGIEPAIGTDCTDAVRLPATLVLESGTALDETVEADVVVDTAGTGVFYLSIELADLQGDATPFGFDPADMAATTFLVSAATVADGWEGELTFQGESFPSGTGPDSTVSATNDPWGTFAVGVAER